MLSAMLSVLLKLSLLEAMVENARSQAIGTETEEECCDWMGVDEQQFIEKRA
jgi:hypothetical protein